MKVPTKEKKNMLRFAYIYTISRQEKYINKLFERSKRFKIFKLMSTKTLRKNAKKISAENERTKVKFVLIILETLLTVSSNAEKQGVAQHKTFSKEDTDENIAQRF